MLSTIIKTEDIFNSIIAAFKSLIIVIWQIPEVRNTLLTSIVGGIFCMNLQYRGFSKKISLGIWSAINFITLLVSIKFF